MAIERDLRAMYSDSALREIMIATDRHAELLRKQGNNERVARIFDDVATSLNRLLLLPKE